jgi:amino acid adenylation domain-containing protein
MPDTQLNHNNNQKNGSGLPVPNAAQSDLMAALAQLLQEAGPKLKPADRDRPLPLSFAQERFWLLHQLAPNNPFYNTSIAFQIQGDLNIEALERSFQEILNRHEILRTSYRTVSGQLVQEVRDRETFEFTKSDPKTTVSDFLDLITKTPFDLDRDALLRAGLLQQNETEWVLVIAVHHIAFDKWSEGLLCGELSALYEAFSQGKPSPLTPLAVQYADFAHWQRQKLTPEKLDRQLDYWKPQLAGHLPRLALPVDYSRPATADYRGAKAHRVLPAALTQAIGNTSRQMGGTRFTILLAAFNLLLHRYTGEDDIIVGSPIATRSDLKLEKLLGCFLNSLALRTDVSGNPTFTELLSRVRQASNDAVAHQEIPFEQVVEAVGGERHPNRPPIFDVMLNVLNTPPQTLKLAGLTIALLEDLHPESQFAMTLYVEEQAGELHLSLLYQTALFSADRIESLLEQFQFLLEQIVADPDRAISAYSLLTPNTPLPDPSQALPEPEYDPVTALFEAQVQQQPQHPAISQGGRNWTYRELGQTARAIAGQLQSAGIRPGDTIAVCGDRSFGVIASMLGILLSGGVLLTLDRSLPQQRLQVMLQEAKAQRLIYVGQMPALDRWLGEFIQVLPVEAERPLTTSTFRPPQLQPDDPAYIFFTSGTTGTPKGVLGRHKGLSHFLTWQRDTFAVGPNDRTGQLTGFSFDVVLRDIFLPLVSGATLCLPDGEANLGAAIVLPWLEKERITLLHTVPSLAQSWLTDRPYGITLRSLQRIFFAGEPLTDRLIRAWREAFPASGELINLYGPTETTLAKFGYRVPTDDRFLLGVQPVGFPQPAVQGLILDAHQQLCGIGEPGEIVIRTPFRSLGYINSPEQQQSKFLPNPWRDDENDILYYSGDRGRYRPDGSIEILGRVDRQVKIRGVRIELGEIESVLLQQATVGQAVAIVREDTPGDKRIVAYVVPEGEERPTQRDLHNFVKTKLPQFMLPGAIVVLDSLPLTANGKVDRRALPAPDQAKAEEERIVVSPRNDMELRLVHIWQETLGIRPVGIRDNFFELGGHSLMVVSLFSLVEQEFGKSLPLSVLFEAPTVEEFAKHLAPSADAKPWDSLVQLRAGDPNKPALFLFHDVEGKLVMYLNLSRQLKTDRAIYGLRPYGKEGYPTLYTRIPQMVRHYVSRIQSVQPEGPYLLCGMCAGGSLAFEAALQLQAAGQEVAFVSFIDGLDVQALESVNKRREGKARSERLQSFLSTFSGQPQPQELQKQKQPQKQQQPKQPKQPQPPQSKLQKLTRLLQKIQHKIANYTGYILRDKLTRLQKHVSLVLFRFCLDWGLPLPKVLQNIPMRSVLDYAKAEYVPQGKYRGRLILFRATEADPGFPNDVPRRTTTDDLLFGWGDRSTEGVEAYDLPGGHASMLREPHVRALVEKFQACLDAAIEP